MNIPYNIIFYFTTTEILVLQYFILYILFKYLKFMLDDLKKVTKPKQQVPRVDIIFTNIKLLINKDLSEMDS